MLNFSSWKGEARSRLVGASGFSTSMICCQDVCLKEVDEQGRAFKRSRPLCDCGGLRVWGHGRVWLYFEGFLQPLFVQRFRCFHCRRVCTCQRSDVWPRFLSDSTLIIDTLISRLTRFRWPERLPRQRGAHWLHRLSDDLLACGFSDDPVFWLRACEADGHPSFPIERGISFGLTRPTEGGRRHREFLDSRGLRDDFPSLLN